MEGIAYGCMKNFFKLDDSPEDSEMAKKLETSLTQQEYANGEVICHIGDKADAMFFIESGKVEIIDKDNQPLNELEQGAYFGEYAVLTGDKRLSTVRSKGGTVLYRMESQTVLDGINYHPTVYGDLIKQLYGQISRKHNEPPRGKPHGILSVALVTAGLVS
jgi:CRP-like cAMP-binding protein